LLSEEAYVSHWQPIKNKIFDNKVHWLPGRIFLPEFKLMSFVGGFTFVEEDLLLLQACMRELGEQYFVVIENTALSYGDYKAYKEEKAKIPGKPLKFKYPVDIKWEELDTGDLLSELMLSVVGRREFYVFGESGLWGKYAATNCVCDISPLEGLFPLDILGFKDVCAALFQEKFHTCMVQEEREDTRKFLTSPSLHPAYKEYTAHLY
jgi:hypothetical protein